MHILQLPTDVFIIVFSYISGRDLVTCKQVCKSFRSLFKASTQLQYKFALARAGLVDGIIKYSMEDRLRLLRQLEQNWHPLELKPRRQLKVLYSSPCTKSEVSSGFVISGIISRDSNCFQELQVYRLPSYVPDLKAKLCKHQLAEKHIQRFKADPVQDLLVLLETPEPIPASHGDDSDVLIRIHLRAFSSNKPHPAASLPFLELSKPHLEEYAGWHRYPHQSFGIRIYLDILAILAKSDGVDPGGLVTSQVTLMVWQWTSGQLLATLSSTSELVFSDFTFIKRDQLLLAHSRSFHGPSLGVVRLICGEPYSTSPDHSVAPMRHYSQQVILQLPAPPGCADQCLDIPVIDIINDPTPCSQHPAIAQNSPVPLFAPDSSQESAMIAFSIPVVLRTPQRGSAPTMHHTLLVRASIFSSFCPSTPWQPVRPIPYDEWSTRGVHWVSGPPGFLHGQRYARTTFDDRWTGVEIYDFNPCHIPAPVSGWQALIKTSRQTSSPPITPRMSNFKTKSSTGCVHNNYLDCENLKSNMRYKKQTMRADFGEFKSSCALDCERVIVLDAERGGYILGFTSYNV